MARDDANLPAVPAALTPGAADARFGPQTTPFGSQPAPNVNVQVNAGALNIHASNLSALERIAAQNPALASELVQASRFTVRTDGRKYTTAAIATGLICLAIIGCSTAIILVKGFFAGISFFLACTAVVAVVTAIFTGKATDLSWTVGFTRGSARPADEAHDETPAGD